MQKLINELQKGRKSGEKEGWISEDEVKKHFQKIYPDALSETGDVIELYCSLSEGWFQ